MTMLTTYLKEIGFAGTAQINFETLRELHRLHTLRFPFENLTPFMHQKVSLSPEDVFRKFIDQGRGGYCFEQNLLFSQMLKEIGFDVSCYGARVLWNQPEELISRRSHMFLLVNIDKETYFADVGFGGLTLTTPIKFEQDSEQKTTHENFRLIKYENDLKLQAKVADVWKTLYRFDLTLHYPVDYEVANFYLYTHPESIFRNNLIAAMPVSHGRYALSNTSFTYYPLKGEPEKKTLESVEEIKEVLKTIFKIELPENEILDQRIKSLISSQG